MLCPIDIPGTLACCCCFVFLKEKGGGSRGKRRWEGREWEEKREGKLWSGCNT